VFLAEAERRIHQHHIKPPLANVHEGEPVASILGEQLPPQVATSCRVAGVVTKGVQHPAFCLRPKLFIGDFGQVE
jgi:hypothetical protein